MAKARYCPLCQRQVVPEKKFNWVAFFLWCLTVVGGVGYLIYHIIFKSKVCPICNSRTRRKAPKLVTNVSV